MKRITNTDDHRLMPQAKDIKADWQKGERFTIETGDVVGPSVFCGLIAGSAYGPATAVFNCMGINYYYPVYISNPEHTRSPPLVKHGSCEFYIATSFPKVVIILKVKPTQEDA